VRILLDECVHAGARGAFPGHLVETVPQAGWSGIKNGKLLQLINAAGYDAFVTIDQNLRYQQNLSALNFAIIVLSIKDHTIGSYLPLFELLRKAVETSRAGDILLVP